MLGGGPDDRAAFFFCGPLTLPAPARAVAARG